MSFLFRKSHRAVAFGGDAGQIIADIQHDIRLIFCDIVEDILSVIVAVIQTAHFIARGIQDTLQGIRERIADDKHARQTGTVCLDNGFANVAAHLKQMGF